MGHLCFLLAAKRQVHRTFPCWWGGKLHQKQQIFRVSNVWLNISKLLQISMGCEMKVRVISTELFGWEEWFESSRNLVDRISSHIWRISHTEVHKNFITKSPAAFWIFHVPPPKNNIQQPHLCWKNDESSQKTFSFNLFSPQPKKIKAPETSKTPQNPAAIVRRSKMPRAFGSATRSPWYFFSLIGNPWCPFYCGNRKYTASQEGTSFLAQIREPFFFCKCLS